MLPRVSDTLELSLLGRLNTIAKSIGHYGRPTRGFNHCRSLLEIPAVLVSFEICQINSLALDPLAKDQSAVSHLSSDRHGSAPATVDTIPTSAPRRSKRAILQGILHTVELASSTMETLPIVDPETELKHILEDVLSLRPGSTLEMVIKQNGIADVPDLLSYDDDALAALKYVDGFIKVEEGNKKAEPEQQTLMSGVVNQVGNLRKLKDYRIEQLDPIMDWTTVTRTDFLTFMRMAPTGYAGTLPASVPPPLLKA